MEREKKKYPIGAEHYTLYEEVGTGVSASVHRALCNPLNEIVAIKILDFERDNCDLNNVSREAQTMVLVDHPNVLKSHCSFVSDHNLWFVMPYMAGGSCLHILKAVHPDGFREVVIASILREALKGLDYLHQHGHIHRDVKAGNILIDSRGGIKLGDFGVSASLFESGDRQRMRNTFVGTPCWMAPEVMEQLHGYDFKADIWSFGITALELAHGHAPFSKYPPMKVLLMTLQNAPPGLDYEGDKKFSKSFKEMTASCLVKDPSKRPSAKKLLRHSFFKQARSADYIARTLLEGLPALGDRLLALKRKEEDMLAQKKIPDGQKEEISQNEYKRGISGWNFNLDDLKAQASLIQDDDIPDKDEDVPGKQLQLQSSSSKQCQQLQYQLSFSDIADTDDNGHNAGFSSIESTANIAKCEKLDEDLSISGSTSEQHGCNIIYPGNENRVENNMAEKSETAENGKSSDGAPIYSHQSDKPQNQSQNLPSCNGSFTPQTVEDSLPELISKGLRTSVNGEEFEEKAKCPVVQQKGRFKVTSENVEVLGAPMLQKSHSLQVISQQPAISPALPCESRPSSSLLHASFATLQSALQTNILQRDCILGLMKQVSLGESLAMHSDTGCNLTNIAALEKSLLEASQEREKDLLREITELQWRLICAQEEVQKYKTENAQVNS